MRINMRVMLKIDCRGNLLGGRIIHYFSRAQNYSWERVTEVMTIVMEKVRDYGDAEVKTCH